MLDLLITSCSVAAVLFVLFKTDAIWEYGNLFFNGHLHPWLQDYWLKKGQNKDFKFIHYLSCKFGGFLGNLIGCPICLGVWLNVVLLFTNNWYLYPVSVVVSWGLYFILCILHNKHDSQIS